MAQIRNIKLELLRPGPAHNQLLSPLTPYLALCGADGPVTVNIPFEHRHLLNRLEMDPSRKMPAASSAARPIQPSIASDVRQSLSPPPKPSKTWPGGTSTSPP